MTEIKEYKVVYKGDVDELTEDVNSLIQAGWELNGGISATVRMQPNSEPLYVYYQAMSRTLRF